MTIRSAFRALGWIVSEIVPGQAVRVALDRDYSRAVTRAAAAHDAVEGLNGFEAENDGLPEWLFADGAPEPPAEIRNVVIDKVLTRWDKGEPSADCVLVEPAMDGKAARYDLHLTLRDEPRAQCKWCGGVDEPGHVCGRESTWWGADLDAYCPGGKGECPSDCDRTQGGCVQTWGPDADHVEALQRNAMTPALEVSDHLEELFSGVVIPKGPPPEPQAPNEYEPSLTDDELIAVRGLIQERYHTDVPAAGDSPRSPQPAAGDTHPSTTIANTLTRGVDDEGLADDCAIQPAPSAGQPNLAAWLEPAILTELFNHACYYDEGAAIYECLDEGIEHFSCGDLQAWREHVAPLIAQRIVRALRDAPAEAFFVQIDEGTR